MISALASLPLGCYVEEREREISKQFAGKEWGSTVVIVQIAALPATTSSSSSSSSLPLRLEYNRYLH